MLNIDNQTAACCRAITRFVNGNGLQPGDKLPSQQELSTLLGYCHNTMTPAMNMLVDSGMFTRKRRAGTILLNPGSYPNGLWRVALPHGPSNGNPGCKFGEILCMSLQSQLQKRNCDVRLYQRLPEYADVIPHTLEHFGNLANDVENSRIDAILTPAFFSKETSEYCSILKIPLCHAGGWEHTPLRVELDVNMLIENAVIILHSYTCRHFALITTNNFENISPKVFSRFRKYSDANRKSGLFEHITARNVLEGDNIVSQILGRDISKRPDALIILNDILALGMASALNGSTYIPKIAIQANRQLSLYYAVPVARFEFDIDLLTNEATGLIISRLLNPEIPDIVISIPPELKLHKSSDKIETSESIFSI